MDIQNFKDKFIPMHIKDIAECTGISYLNCWVGEWKDGAGNVHNLDEMSSRYLENCLKELNKGVEFCKYMYVGQLRGRLIKIINDIDRYNRYSDIDTLNEEEKKEIAMCIRDEALKLMEEKISEIEDELERR